MESVRLVVVADPAGEPDGSEHGHDFERSRHTRLDTTFTTRPMMVATKMNPTID
jgi:hypothetical protein